MYDGPGKEKDGLDDKIAYAIKLISIVTNVFPLELVDCNEDKLINRWELFDINWIDVSTKHTYLREKKFMYESIDTIMKNLEILRTYHVSGIPRLLNSA
jgi:hypothetical protein